MYLAMENGDIYYMEVEETSMGLVQATSKASSLECSIGTAFAVLDNGLGRDDRIVAGGEMSSGGIYLVSATKTVIHSPFRGGNIPLTLCTSNSLSAVKYIRLRS
jgi:hypothetical protein